MFNGNIKLYTGPMFGGKSNSLMNEYDKYSRVHKKCILIRYIFDDRYENSITHNQNYNIIKQDENNKILSSGIELNEIKCKYLYEIDNKINNYEIIFIDEIQFFEDCDIFCEKWANEGKIIRLAGLICTYERKLFNNIKKLLPLIEKIEYCSAVCTDNNNEAVFFTERTTNNDEEIIIGNDDIYKPVDRKIWFNNKRNYINLYTRLIKRYNEEYNKHNNTNIIIDINKLQEYLDENFPRNIIFKDCLLLCSKDIIDVINKTTPSLNDNK